MTRDILKNTVRVPLLALTFWMLPCSGSRTEYAMNQEPQAVVACSLSADESVTAGSAVLVRMSLQNLTRDRLYVLRWYTPFEGLQGRIFRITHSGEEVEYRGPMIRRGDPIREQYIVLEPGAQISSEVDLTTGYDLSRAGDYRIEFVSGLHDVARDERSIPPGDRPMPGR